MDTAWAAGMAGRNPIEQDDRDARTPGETEARLLASLRLSGIALVAARGQHGRRPGAAVAAEMQLGGEARMTPV